MAVTSFPANDALSNKLWAKTLTVEALKPTFFGRFMGTGSGNMIQIKSDTQKAPGDRITFALRLQLLGAGVTEGQTLEGNEESLATYADNIFINELAHAVRVKSENRIDAQRVPFDLRAEARDGLRDWYSDRFDTAMFLHLGGVSAQTDPRFNGNNTPTAPSSTRRVFTGGLSSDQAIQAAQAGVFTLDLIDKAVERAKTGTPLMRPLRSNGDEYFVIFLHPYSAIGASVH